jgi:excinuclease ABC subunit A
MYVLDEPSIGLHQRDNDRLLATLKHLRDLGNSVIVVEHDEDAINMADYVVDMGPARASTAGRSSRRARPRTSGTPRTRSPASISPGIGRSRFPQSATWRSRQGAAHRRRERQQPEERVAAPAGRPVRVRDGRVGVGKSTLINDTLYHAVARHLYDSAEEPAPFAEIEGSSTSTR